MILQDKTGTIDAKIWDPNSMGIREFEALDYVDIMGDVSSFNGVTGAITYSPTLATYSLTGVASYNINDFTINHP